MTEITEQRARQALILWGVYIVLNIFLNGTIPFLLGKDMHAWTASPIKDVLINLIPYSVVFLVAPLILTKGWDTVRRPTLLLPLTLAILAMTLRTYLRLVAAIAVFVLAWLHYRYDLSELGFRSRECDWGIAGCPAPEHPASLSALRCSRRSTCGGEA